MSRMVDRRRFLETATAAGVAYGVHSAIAAADEKKSANDKIVVAVMGVNGRGSSLVKGFATQPGSEVAYVCDVDERALAKGIKVASDSQPRKPTGMKDFRKALEDKSVDVLVIAAPNHWHAPATIIGCQMGKHVYVEKPCSHNPREGEIAVEAARKYNRVVTQGTQRRSWPAIREGIEKVRGGEIGRVLYCRSYYNNMRPNIGKGKPAEIPAWLDYALWQGPAPERPFKDNLLHYNWHWHWHWGNGELGNNGVHALDVARWGLGVDYPTRVISAGAKYRHDDDQETPDTHLVTFEFGDKSIMWEGLSWSKFGPGGNQFGITFHGESGVIAITGDGYKLFDLNNKEVLNKTGAAGDVDHQANFLNCIRNGGRPNADIEEAHKSTLLCHLGNISHRVGRILHCDPKNGHIVKDDQAMALWAREYRPGWEPKA